MELLQLAFSRIFLLLRFQEASEGTSVLGSAESDRVFLFNDPGFFCSRKFVFWVMFHQYSCQRLLRRKLVNKTVAKEKKKKPQ